MADDEVADTAIRLPKPIRKLDQVVVNRIAAGEIIQRPANALKELIENALDAGSTSINILVKDGGLKLLQIQDNGHGIRKEDLSIVCERFTTSKLKTFEDLQTVSTYGFRGEALASITHVAHVTITTKTAESPCAWRAAYSDGRIKPAKPGEPGEAKACAGNDGTLITVEDLFFNVPTRKKAFKNTSEEYNRIVDVVNRYAIHNAGRSFVCKKQGMNTADVSTQARASKLDNIRSIYGQTVATELIPFQATNDRYELQAEGLISKANYNIKKMVFLLFINHRSVDHSSLRKAIENLYTAYLPKGTHPFIYLSLLLKPENVDVNVHPTKREVAFLNEDEIIESICDSMQQQLAGSNSSRTFAVQTVLPTAPVQRLDDSQIDTVSQKPKPIYAYNMNRNDTQDRTLDSMISRTQVPRKRPLQEMEDVFTESANGHMPMAVETDDGQANRPRVQINLTTVKELRAEVMEKKHDIFTDILSRHVFVGIADEDLSTALIQHETSLYLVSYDAIAESFFYQIGLAEFGNFGVISLSPPVKVYDLIRMALEDEQNLPMNMDVSKDEVAHKIAELLVDRRAMLEEYFSMSITEDGTLETLPLLLHDYLPDLDRLPSFLIGLGPNVDWESEKECFESFLHELARFYIPLAPLRVDNDTYEEELDTYRKQVEHVLFPAVKAHFIATTDLVRPAGIKGGLSTSEQPPAVVQLTSLQRLYKVFERC